MTSTELAATAKVASHARLIADALASMPPDTPAPTSVDLYEFLDRPTICWNLSTDKGQRETARAIIRSIGGTWQKVGNSQKYFRFVAERAGVDLEIVADREQVCRRIVTGTREVTKMVPAPDAPLIEVTETVEDVEWECEPLLAEAAS